MEKRSNPGTSLPGSMHSDTTVGTRQPHNMRILESKRFAACEKVMPLAEGLCDTQ